MGNILIRKADKKDLDAILCLNLALFKKEFREFDKSLNIKWTYSRKGRDYFNKRISDRDGFTAVALDGPRIIGYICGGLHYSSTRVAVKAELENMIVVEKFRNKKIGSRLAKEFFQWCKSKKIKSILVTAFVKNSAAIDFYKSLGFRGYELSLEKTLK